MLTVVEPLERVAAVPYALPSTDNCTVPVGVPAPGADAATVIENSTGCPKTDGLTPDEMLVVVLALLTVSCNAADVLLLKLASSV